MGVTYVSDDASGAYDNVSGVWTIGNIANGAVTTLRITATVDVGANAQPQPITNTVTAATSDQVDPDTLTDDLSQDIFITVIDPNLIRLVKTAGRERAAPGEMVSYSIEIRNSTPFPVSSMQLADTPARGFKFVSGTAQLDGVAIDDPSRGLPLVFDIGSVPGLVDTNGNGAADPGEPGYRVLSYRLVAGAGVAPGVWSNSAAAFVSCDDCLVSNTAKADIEIVEDTLFDLGTIIGKVFYDANSDGWQDAGEGGIAAAMVVLDDGTYVLTDKFGRYHFPAVKPGQRLVKINLNSLAGRAVATNDKTQILNVTPGLLAKANFGVILDTVDAAIGADGKLGIMVDSSTMEPPILINGSTVAMSLLVNGQPATLAMADVRLSTRQLDDVVELDGGNLASPILFTTDANKQIETWELLVTSSQGEVVYSRSGDRQVPAVIEWDGICDNGKLIGGGDVYSYQMTLITDAGENLTSNRRIFGVNRRNTVSLNLAGGAFITGSHELTNKAKVLLKHTAEAIRTYPDEVIVIAGHTDSVGNDENNMVLAERRARSAFNYLTTTEQIPQDRFVIQAYGESRPIADNDSEWGRELNRRVEINGDLRWLDMAKNYDPYHQPPLVRIDGREVPVDDNGRFVAKLDSADAQDSMQVLLATAQGRRIETTIPLPTIKILEPSEAFAIAYEEQLAGQWFADSTAPQDAALTISLLAQTEPGNTVELDGEELDVDEHGLFETVIKVKAGENIYGLVARNPVGMLRITNLRLSVTDTVDGEPAVVVEPIPQLALQLPPRGVPMTNARLIVPGTTVPGNRVYVNDTEVDVDETGNFVLTMELARGENPFTARVVDSNRLQRKDRAND